MYLVPANLHLIINKRASHLLLYAFDYLSRYWNIKKNNQSKLNIFSESIKVLLTDPQSERLFQSVFLDVFIFPRMYFSTTFFILSFISSMEMILSQKDLLSLYFLSSGFVRRSL